MGMEGGRRKDVEMGRGKKARSKQMGGKKTNLWEMESLLLKMLYLQAYSVYLNFAGEKIAAETHALKRILSLPNDYRFFLFIYEYQN